MRKQPPCWSSGATPKRSSPITASPASPASSLTTCRVTPAGCSPNAYAPRASPISESGLTRPGTLAKSNVTTGSWPKSSSTPAPTSQKPNEPRPSLSGTSTTTTTDPTPPAETSHPPHDSPPASTTSCATTPSSDYAGSISGMMACAGSVAGISTSIVTGILLDLSEGSFLGPIMASVAMIVLGIVAFGFILDRVEPIKVAVR